MVHHGDEEVEEDDDVDEGVAAEHEEAEEARELLDARQLEVLQVDQTEHRPEQRLRRLPQAANVELKAMRQMPLECDINIAVNGPFWVEVVSPEHHLRQC